MPRANFCRLIHAAGPSTPTWPATSAGTAIDSYSIYTVGFGGSASLDINVGESRRVHIVYLSRDTASSSNPPGDPLWGSPSAGTTVLLQQEYQYNDGDYRGTSGFMSVVTDSSGTFTISPTVTWLEIEVAVFIEKTNSTLNSSSGDVEYGGADSYGSPTSSSFGFLPWDSTDGVLSVSGSLTTDEEVAVCFQYYSTGDPVGVFNQTGSYSTSTDAALSDPSAGMERINTQVVVSEQGSSLTNPLTHTNADTQLLIKNLYKFKTSGQI